jgi:mannan endo-1,4-beta-mannosidase
MKSLITLALVSFTLALTAATPPRPGPSRLERFVAVKGDQLMDGDRLFRFISFNIPNLHLVEDSVVFDLDNAWRWPDRFEITDALESVRQEGGTVVRTYVLSVVRTNDAPGIPRHVLGPGRFNEEGFRALDEVLAVANQTGVRIILPFVDNWSWWGGIGEYAGFRGKSKEAFWTDPQIIADFKQTIRFVLTRTNTGWPCHRGTARG